MVVKTIMIQLPIALFFIAASLLSFSTKAQQTDVTPIRIICQTTSFVNSQMLQLRSDAGDTFKPPLLTILDPAGKPFKEIDSHQIVYGDDNVTIVFVAAVDSQNRFGVYKVVIQNLIKTSSSQFLNLLPIALRNFVTYSRDFNFTLFSMFNGALLYPSNEAGQWRMIALGTGAVVKEWTLTPLLFNPVLKDQMATWTLANGETSQLYTYNFKTDARDVVNFKDKIQVLNINKEEIVLVNYFMLDAKKRTIRVQSFINGSTRVLYELDASTALFGNFVSVGTSLMFTSEKTSVVGTQVQVAEAYLNVLDTTKNLITQRIKYPPILVDLMRKQTAASLKFLDSPMFNQSEVLFSLDEMGGVVKYQFKTGNWFLIHYPNQENSCYNPSYVTIPLRR